MAKTFLLFLLLVPLSLFSQRVKKEIPSFIQNRIASTEKETAYKKQLAEALALLRWGKENDNAYVSAKAYQYIADVYRPQRGNRLFKADSLFLKYAATNTDTLLYFEALRLYIGDLLNDNFTDKAKLLLNCLDTVAGNNATAYEKSVANQLRGFYYFKKFDPKTALPFYQKSIAYAEAAHNDLLKARSFAQISFCYTMRMNNDSASWYLLRALAIHQKTRNFFETASDYDALGFLFRTSANKEKALEYYSDAIQYYQKSNAPVNAAYENLALGEMYIGWKQPGDAIIYLEKAKSGFEKIYYEQGLSYTYSLLSRYYAQIKNIDSANYFSGKAKKMTAGENPLSQFFTAGQEIAKEIELGHYQKSDSLINSILPDESKIFPDEIVKRSIAKAYAGTDSTKVFFKKNYSSADNGITASNAAEAIINPFSGFPNAKDSLINSLVQQNQKTIEHIDSLKRQLVKDSLNRASQQIVLKEKELRIKNLSLLLFSIALAAAAILVFFAVRSRIRINDEKEYALHYAKGNLQIIDDNIAELRKKNTVENKLDVLKEKIYPLSILFHTLGSKLTEKVYMTDYLNSICNNLSRAYSLDRDITTTVDAPVYLKGEKAQFAGLIVNELVTNSFKYAFTDRKSGEIKVTCMKQKKGYMLSVEDNGNGFDVKNVTKGQGTELIAGLAQQLRAKIKKGESEGTSFEFYFF